MQRQENVRVVSVVLFIGLTLAAVMHSYADDIAHGPVPLCGDTSTRPRRKTLAATLNELRVAATTTMWFIALCCAHALIATTMGLSLVGVGKVEGIPIGNIVLGAAIAVVPIAFFTIIISSVVRATEAHARKIEPCLAEAYELGMHGWWLTEPFYPPPHQKHRGLRRLGFFVPILKTLGFIASGMYGIVLSAVVFGGALGEEGPLLTVTEALACGAAGTAYTLGLCVSGIYFVTMLKFASGKMMHARCDCS